MLGKNYSVILRNFTDLKNYYLIQVIDLRFQVDHINPKKIQLHEDYRGAINNARLCVILIRHWENKIISEGNKITEVTVICGAKIVNI